MNGRKREKHEPRKGDIDYSDLSKESAPFFLLFLFCPFSFSAFSPHLHGSHRITQHIIQSPLSFLFPANDSLYCSVQNCLHNRKRKRGNTCAGMRNTTVRFPNSLVQEKEWCYEMISAAWTLRLSTLRRDERTVCTAKRTNDENYREKRCVLSSLFSGHVNRPQIRCKGVRTSSHLMLQDF